MEEPAPPRFTDELRDAVTTRAAALVVGVLLLQLGFIASYLGAFHRPRPHRVPIAVVAPAPVAARLTNLPGQPLDARVAPDEAAARAMIEDRRVYAAFVAGPDGRDRLLVTTAAGASVATAVEAVIATVERDQGRTFTVVDAVPAAAGDARGLSAFYLVVGWVVGGYLVAAILGIAGGARPVNRRRAVIRLGALAAYAVVSGFGGALIAETVLAALPGHFTALWALGALLVFAVGAFTMAAQVVLGIIGIGVAIALFVVLGNPSAGGAYPAPLLPPFWAAIGGWLPPGAGTDAVRDVVYFPAASPARDVVVIAAYAVVGVVVTVLASRAPGTAYPGEPVAG